MNSDLKNFLIDLEEKMKKKENKKLIIEVSETRTGMSYSAYSLCRLIDLRVKKDV